MLYAVDFPRAPFNSISIVISSPLSECTPRSILLNLINAIIGGCKKVHTQEGAADVLGDLVAGLGLGEVAELLVEHPLELKGKGTNECTINDVKGIYFLFSSPL